MPRVRSKLRNKTQRGVKRTAPKTLDHAIREKRRHINRQDQLILHLKEQLIIKKNKLKECLGVESILRSKVLKTDIARLTLELERAQNDQDQKDMHRYMAMVDQLEKQSHTAPIRRQKEVLPCTRLLPPKPSKRSLFDMMTQQNADRWKLLRAHKKRYAVRFGQEGPSVRINPVDVCPDCGVDREVDRETAISVCPKCGTTRTFASHIIDTKDVEKDDNHTTRQQNQSHMQKFANQFERGYPCTPMSVLESVAVEYSKYHLHDPAKVQSCRTTQLLKGLKNLPKTFKKAPDRMTKELKRESIPEYTSAENSQLLNQRNRLRMPEEVSIGPSGEEKKHKKSFSNQIYMRQLGRANRLEISRLFPHAKTLKIHMERTRAMEKECEMQKTNLGDQEGQIWSLFPST